MKKILFFLVSTLLLWGCGDETPKTKKEQLLGKWKLEKIVENGYSYPLSECHKKFNLFFEKDKCTKEVYEPNETGICVLESKSTEKYDATEELVFIYISAENETQVMRYRFENDLLIFSPKYRQSSCNFRFGL